MNEFGLTNRAQQLLNNTRNIFSDGQVVVNNGARSVASNSRIAGASRRSQHIGGDAFDFKVIKDGRQLPNKEVVERIMSSGVDFNQVIDETGLGMRDRVHLGVGDKRRLTIGRDGRYTDIAQGAYRQAINKVLGERFGNKVSDVLKGTSDTIAKTGDTISKSTSFVNSYINRGIFGIMGLAFIVGVIFYLIRKSK